MTNDVRSVGRSLTGRGRRDNAISPVRRSRRFAPICLMFCLGVALVTGCASATTQSAGAVPTMLGQTTTPSSPAASPSSPTASLSSPPASASSPAASPAAAQAFSSKLYGFEVILPPSWNAERAIAGWASPELEGSCPSDWDCFHGADGRSLAVAAIDVPKGTTLQSWQTKILASSPSFVTDAEPPAKTTLGGQRALEWTATAASEGVDAIKLVALHGTRAYALLFVAPMSFGIAADQRVFDSIVSTFEFSGG